MTLRARPLLGMVALGLLAAGLVACEDGASDAGGPTTTAAEPRASELVLRGDGLGVVDLGVEPATAIEAVSEELGEPTRDSGWAPASSEYGTCPGEEIRGVEWDHLVLLFTDGTTDHGSGQHLFAWRLSGAPPAVGTATGFGVGATVTDAEELHPGEVRLTPAEAPFPAFLEIDAEGGAITAYLGDDGRVTNLEAGTPCGE